MTLDLSYINENISEIRERVALAAAKYGRKPEDVTLIAVTKTLGIDKIQQALKAGIKNLGENRVQELCEKYDIIGSGYNWHLIGHLQTNKVKYIVDKVSLIHSVDRLELAREIQKRAEQLNCTVNVLIQVNVSKEESKFGIEPEVVLELVKSVSNLNNIRVKGLMTIAPFEKEPEDTRGVFSALRKIFIDIKKENIDNIDMDYLSMGMSNDFEIAIEEGANMVRIGTSIFGKRQY